MDVPDVRIRTQIARDTITLTYTRVEEGILTYPYPDRRGRIVSSVNEYHDAALILAIMLRSSRSVSQERREREKREKKRGEIRGDSPQSSPAGGRLALSVSSIPRLPQSLLPGFPGRRMARLLVRPSPALASRTALSRSLSDGRWLRSQQWFDNPQNPGMTALYLERYLNFGLTREELQSGRPIVGIAQTGSDLSPCNRVHVELASRVRDGIRDAGGVPLEFPCHPIQETGRRPTAALDRNLTYMALVEVLHGYPLDGVVLTTGCDKTTPALLMAAATADLPAIVLSGGPMLDGWWEGSLAGSGSVIWDSRRRLAAGEIDYDQFLDRVCSSAPSVGHCNTMGTVSAQPLVTSSLGSPRCRAAR